MKQHSSWSIQFYKEKVKPPFALYEWYKVYTLWEVNWYPTIISWWNFKEETSFCDQDSPAIQDITWHIFSNIKLLDDKDSVLIDISNASLGVDRDWIYDEDWDFPNWLTWLEFAEAINEISWLSIFIKHESFFRGREYITELLWENFKLIITE